MHEGLLEAIRTQSAVFVVGTGLSVAATGGADCANWTGLIRSGIERLVNAGLRDSEWAETVVAMIGREETSFTVQAASQVGDAFKEVGDVAFAKWLRETAGSLTPTSPDFPSALAALPIPLLTTNYDTLIEQASDRATATWEDAGEMQKILANRSKSVGHLHGAWDQPSSVILSSSDYSKLLASDSAKAIQYAFGASKSTIYLGVGAGLSDPNFSRFLEWQRKSFPNPGLIDYRLCTESELADLQAFHIGDNITPVAYGAVHDDLASFLRELQASLSDIERSEDGLLYDPAGEVRAEFAAALREEIIVSQSIDDSPHVTLDDVVLPPIMLAVPNAQYVAANSSGDKKQVFERLDLEVDLQTDDVVLLVGEEGSGLTFAAKLMAYRASVKIPLLAPLYLNFTGVRAEPKPIIAGLRRQARSAGWPLTKKDALPPLALAIDDYSPYVPKVSDRAIEDLPGLAGGFIVVACRQGTEEEVQRKLASAGLKVRIRYLGKLERSDIEHLARIAAPAQFADLAETVINLLKSEHLPRTPYTVSQLLYILLSSGSVGGNASSTSVLEEYVELLLGRGDPHDDARIGLDHVQRMAILERLAEKFVEVDKSGISESAAVLAVEEIIENLGWPESAMEVLLNFIDRHVLAKRGGFVVFARSSYLHLFAAKQAQKSAPFRDLLLSKPLYYVSAIADYASLNRHDNVLLDRVEAMLSGLEWTGRPSEIFAELDLVEPSFELVEESPTPDERPHARAVGNTPQHVDDFSDDDPPPFPVSNEEDQPPLWRQIQTVDLCSRILRDADQAGDVTRKQTILGTLLHQWGDLISELDSDEAFQDLFATIAETMRERMIGEDGKPIEQQALDELQMLIPAAIAYGGISETLASRKLLKPMDGLISSGTASEVPETAVASIFFELAVSERGWATRVKTILSSQKNTWVVRNFVFFLLFSEYFAWDASNGDDTDLLDSLVEIVSRSNRYDDDKQRKQHARIIRANLRSGREMERKKTAAKNAISGAATTGKANPS